jgi:hypothetical protein
MKKENKTASAYYQQGDVLFFSEDIPKSLDNIDTPIVEHGEHTGHAHRLQEADEYEHLQHPNTKERYLRIVRPATVTHEEHMPVTLPPGEYRIGRVREKGMFDDLIAPVID